MLWLLIILIFILINYISIFGDYENKKIKQEEKEVNELLEGRRNGEKNK